MIIILDVVLFVWTRFAENGDSLTYINLSSIVQMYQPCIKHNYVLITIHATALKCCNKIKKNIIIIFCNVSGWWDKKSISVQSKEDSDQSFAVGNPECLHHVTTKLDQTCGRWTVACPCRCLLACLHECRLSSSTQNFIQLWYFNQTKVSQLKVNALSVSWRLFKKRSFIFQH